MASRYGVITDHWSFGDTYWKPTASTSAPAYTETQQADSLGDICESSFFDTNTPYSVTYARCGTDTAAIFYDTATGIDFRLGKVISNKVILNIELGTDNQNRPTCTIAGENCPTADSDVAKFDPSDLEISTARKATPIGGAADSGSYVNSCSATASVQFAEAKDSLGARAVLQVYAGRVESTIDVVGGTAAPGITADTGWAASQPVGDNQGNTEFGTGSATFIKNLARM